MSTFRSGSRSRASCAGRGGWRFKGSRAADAGVDWAILVTGYSPEALAQLSGADLGADRLAEMGAVGVQSATYRLDYLLSHDELDI